MRNMFCYKYKVQEILAKSFVATVYIFKFDLFDNLINWQLFLSRDNYGGQEQHCLLAESRPFPETKSTL